MSNSQSNGRKLSKSASGLRMIPVSDTYACPFALAEPMWVSDKEVSSCLSCKKIFDFFKRKHHCRRCGQCFCDSCCHYVIPLKRMYFVDPVRHCYECAVLSKAEVEFYDKTLKTLISGSDFTVHDNETSEVIGRYKCHLSNDFRCILFQTFKAQSPGEKFPPKVVMVKIQAAKFSTSQAPEAMNLMIPTGLTLKCKDEEDSAVVHDLRFTSIDKKASVAWLSALQKAFKMLFESREENESPQP